MFRDLKDRVSQRRLEPGDAKPHCRRGKHKWRTTGRVGEGALTYICEVCGETSDTPPRRGSKWSAAEAPYHKAAGGGGPPM